jgi:5,10-methylenetetrahydromethanopterin reductase
MDISFATATTPDSAEHVAVAEELGYERAWFYDTPQQSPDVWMTLALAAGRTRRIGLGPGVLVPSLRHPMVNAAATAALAALAPGRVAVAFGTGFTGRRAMGIPRPIAWSYMERYIRAFRGLMRGETVEWEGARMRMLHPPGHAASRPVDVPVLIGAQGPRGRAVAAELADGLFTVAAVPDFAKEFAWVPHLCWGTVLDDGEEPTSDRVRAAGGPGTVVALHGVYEYGGPVEEMPGGAAWLEQIERAPESERHLAVHDGHCIALNAADEAAWAAGAHALLKAVTVSGTPDEVRERVATLAEQGVTEVVYQPAGPDIRRELERFMDAAGASPASDG